MAFWQLQNCHFQNNVNLKGKKKEETQETEMKHTGWLILFEQN